MSVSRRQFLAVTIPALAVCQAPPKRVLRIVCIGGHPDDPESGCGGTLARYAALGHAITVIYLTRGEAGIPGKSHDEAAAIRSAEVERPDVVFTQWPIDTHLDHQAASTLTFRAWLSGGRRFDLYYYEVDLGVQTMGFHPTDYVDITAVREMKKTALFAHKSQNGEEIYRRHHEIMENFRGREAGVAAAEAFVHLARGTGISSLPGLAL
jgi:LmbE family N-acetylglucosaminyl deacetylase